MSKKPLYILKLGGSVVTYKNRLGLSVRRPLLRKIAREIKNILDKNSFQLIVVHGAGAAGHQLAKKYNLQNGTGKDKKKLIGSLLTQKANYELNSAIVEIFINETVNMVPVHTASSIIQKNKKIAHCNLKNISETLKQNCIPVLYGEMVFDKDLGMSICSGDSIVSHLANKLGAEKILFATDVDGMFDRDPFRHKHARLVEKIFFKEIRKEIKLSESHNIDVTGGLGGKIDKMKSIAKSRIKTIEIFNGLQEKNYRKIFFEKDFPHTKILL